MSSDPQTKILWDHNRELLNQVVPLKTANNRMGQLIESLRVKLAKRTKALDKVHADRLRQTNGFLREKARADEAEKVIQELNSTIVELREEIEDRGEGIEGLQETLEAVRAERNAKAYDAINAEKHASNLERKIQLLEANDTPEKVKIADLQRLLLQEKQEKQKYAQEANRLRGLLDSSERCKEAAENRADRLMGSGPKEEISELQTQLNRHVDENIKLWATLAKVKEEVNAWVGLRGEP